MDKLQNNKKTVFTVPEGYFEQLNKEIIGATAGSRPASPRHKSHIIGKFSRLTGYAAAVALLLFVAKNILTPDNDNDNNNDEKAYDNDHGGTRQGVQRKRIYLRGRWR